MGDWQAGTWSLQAALPSLRALDQEVLRLERAAEHGSHCLVADGQQSMRMLLGHALKEAGYTRIHLAADGYTAQQALRAHDCDLAVVDQGLPGIGGLSLLDAIRRNEAMASMVFLMVSGRNLDKQVLRVAEEPWDAFLTKPVSPKLLMSRLDLIVERRLATARALRLAVADQTDRAVELLLGASRDNPGYTWPMFVMGQILGRAGRMDQATECYQRALEIDPEAVAALVAMGRIAAQEGRPAEARGLYRRAIEANQAFCRAYDVLAESLIDEGRTGEAVDTLAQAVAGGGGHNAERQEKLGDLYLEVRRYADAEQCYLAARDLDSARGPGPLNLKLGKARLAQGDHLPAIAALSEAAARGGDPVLAKDALLMLGAAHLQNERPDLAEQAFAKAADPTRWPPGETPYDPKEVHRRAGAMFLRRGHVEEARRSLMLSLPSGEGRQAALAEVTGLCDRWGQSDLAAELNEAATAATDGRLEQIVSQAISMVGQQQYGQAEQLYQQALGLAPDAGRVHFNLGKLYLRMDQTDRGGDHLEHALRFGLGADDLDLCLELARVYAALGQPGEARRVLEAMLARAPDHPAALAALYQLVD